MIQDKLVAQQISDLMLAVGKQINESIQLVMNTCSEKEFEDYRSAVTHIMGSMLLDVMNPIYDIHPDIKPPELN